MIHRMRAADARASRGQTGTRTGRAESENRVAHAGSERKTSEMKKGGRNGENPQDFCLFFHKKVALQKGRHV